MTTLNRLFAGACVSAPGGTIEVSEETLAQVDDYALREEFDAARRTWIFRAERISTPPSTS